jgi:hypothetical protein
VVARTQTGTAKRYKSRDSNKLDQFLSLGREYFQPSISIIEFKNDLGEQISGSDPTSGNPETLNGNINALFLRNNGGQNVEFSADNNIALNAILEDRERKYLDPYQEEV